MHKFLVVLTLSLLLMGCQESSVNQAKAHAIRTEANTEARATATAVAILEKSASMRVAATATAIADNEKVMAETQAERIERKENLIWWSTVGGVVVLLALVLGFSVASVGSGAAVAYKARLQARLVRLDRNTRTWPVMLDLKTGYIVDLETGERARIGDVHQLDYRRLMISGRVRESGLLAQAAERIAKTTKSPQPADMLPAVAQNVPLLKDGGLDKPPEMW